jgi:hypothetical protein
MVFLSMVKHPGLCLKLASEVKSQLKIKCLKLKCTCGKEGAAQAFLNKSGQVRYVRVRHYLKPNSETKKPMFEYHRIENFADDRIGFFTLRSCILG